MVVFVSAADAEYKLADAFTDTSACVCGCKTHVGMRSNVRMRLYAFPDALMETFSSAHLCCAAVRTVVPYYSPRRTVGWKGRAADCHTIAYTIRYEMLF